MIRKGGGIQTSVIVSTGFYEMCKKYNIKFSEALRVGISLLLAEKGVAEYDNNLNIHRKMTLFRQQLEEALQKLTKLEEKQNRISEKNETPN